MDRPLHPIPFSVRRVRANGGLAVHGNGTAFVVGAQGETRRSVVETLLRAGWRVEPHETWVVGHPPAPLDEHETTELVFAMRALRVERVFALTDAPARPRAAA
jgi:hypothetical protein